MNGRRSRPGFEMLEQDTVERVLQAAADLLKNPGVRIHSPQALELLAEHGAEVERGKHIVRLGVELIERALESAPGTIRLFDRDGNPSITLGGDQLSFMPGSSAPYIMDQRSRRPRPVNTTDQVKFARLVDALPSFQHNHMALIPADVPEGFQDSYRLFLALLNTTKTLSGGAFSTEGLQVMREMLTVVAGGEDDLQARPRMTVACCPISPLSWGGLGCQTLVDCARARIPVRVVPAPLAGGTAPVSLVGAVVQQTAENLSGIAIHQLVNPGAPIYYGTAAAVMDMRSGVSLFGAIESQMMNLASVQIGRHLGLATHAIVGFSEAKRVDAQAGLEAAQGIYLAAVAGANHLAGPGMLESGLCQSLEKLVIDHEICRAAARLHHGITCDQKHLAVELIREVGHEGNFLAAAHTAKWLRQEHLFPSEVIDRSTRTQFEAAGEKDAWERACDVVEKILESHEVRPLADDKRLELFRIIRSEARRHGCDLPPDIPKPSISG